MNITDEIYKIITLLEKNQEYLQLGDITPLINPLQKFDYENWDYLMVQINDWTNQQRIILTNALLEIGDNKRSNYDTSKIVALSFIMADRKNAEVLMNHLDFLNNGIPKDIELINRIFEKLKWLENNHSSRFLNVEKAYNLINQLYIDGVVPDENK